MKKTVLTLAIALMMGTTVFAQQGGGALRRSKEYREYLNAGKMNDGMRSNNTPMLPNGFGNPGDVDGTDTPLGSGIAVLVGLGAAYAIGKKRKEE